MKNLTLDEILDIDKRVITVEEFGFIIGSINNAVINIPHLGYEKEDYVSLPVILAYLESEVGEKGFIILDNETDIVHLGKRD